MVEMVTTHLCFNDPPVVRMCVCVVGLSFKVNHIPAFFNKHFWQGD